MKGSSVDGKLAGNARRIRPDSKGNVAEAFLYEYIGVYTFVYIIMNVYTCMYMYVPSFNSTG